MTIRIGARARAALFTLASAGFALPVAAVENVVVQLATPDEELREILKNNSVVKAAQAEDRTAASDIYAAALAEYGRMTETLYSEGYYSGVVDVLVDGQQAADIPLLRVPDQITTVTLVIDQGPKFRFGRAEVQPLAQGTELPEDFKTGRRARAGARGAGLHRP